MEKLKSNDLRIGNIIIRKDNISNKKEVNVTVALLSEMEVRTGCEYFGIPLTEDWLIRFEQFSEYDFIRGRKFYKYGNLILEIIPNRVVIYWSNEILCFKEYVHELQNFMHSTFDIELTIKTTIKELIIK